jgi:hypothetical protein
MMCKFKFLILSHLLKLRFISKSYQFSFQSKKEHTNPICKISRFKDFPDFVVVYFHYVSSIKEINGKMYAIGLELLPKCFYINIFVV